MTSLLLTFAAAVIILSSNFSIDAFQLLQLQRYESKKHHSTIPIPSRRDVLISITVSPLVSLLPTQPAFAKNNESMNYQDVYFDPKHPDGYRILFGDDQRATLLLKDGQTSDELALPVKVIKEAGKDTRLLFDYSKYKGGSSQVEGIFTRKANAEYLAAGDKIRTVVINDTNGKQNEFWINKKFEGPIGVWKDNSNPKRSIIIRQVNNNKGAECIVEIRDGDKVTTLSAIAGNTFIFNFPDKGEVKAVFSLFRRTLTFDDGTVWLKY